MKFPCWLMVVILSLDATPLFADTGNLNTFLGQKTLNENDWSPVDRQGELGILYDVRGDKWPVSFALGLLSSAHSVKIAGIDITGSTVEVDIGIQKEFDIRGSALHPFVAGGPAIVRAKLKAENGSTQRSEDRSGGGYWVSSGIFWTFATDVNLGLEVRHSKADVDLFGISRHAGGNHIGIILGFHW